MFVLFIMFCIFYAKALMLTDRQREIEAERLRGEGNECFRHKLFNKSVLLYTRALEMDPTNSVLWSNRAQAYLNLHKPEKAYMDACGALELEPNNCKALFRRALALNRLGLKGRAREDALRCAQLGGENRGVQELLVALRDETDVPLVDITVFQRPERLQSQRFLAKKQIVLAQ